MPNIKSAKKRLKQSIARHAKNLSTKRSINTECKKLLATVKAGDVEKSDAQLRVVAKKVDKAAAKKVIHVNAAARVKSRLSARVKKLKGK